MLRITILCRLNVRSSVHDVISIFRRGACRVLTSNFYAFHLRFSDHLRQFRSNGACKILLNAFNVRYLTMLLVLYGKSSALRHNVQCALRPALLCNAIRRGLLPRIEVSLHQPMFNGTEAIGMFLHFPLRRIKELSMYGKISTFHRFPSAIPAIINANLRRIQFRRPLRLPPKTRIQISGKTTLYRTRPSITVKAPN